MADHTETLKDALARTGDAEHAAHLTPQALKMTKSEITDFLNGKIDGNLSLATIQSLRKFAKQRIIEGKSVFPWGAMENVKHSDADDNMGGGFW